MFTNPPMRDVIDQIKIEFHPDNPKIKLSLISFLLESGVIPDPDHTKSVDAFNAMVREISATVTGGYENYLKDCYELAKDRDKEREKLSIASINRKPDSGDNGLEGPYL